MKRYRLIVNPAAGESHATSVGEIMDRMAAPLPAIYRGAHAGLSTATENRLEFGLSVECNLQTGKRHDECACGFRARETESRRLRTTTRRSPGYRSLLRGILCALLL